MLDPIAPQTRPYTPAEIATIVRSYREGLGWKQIALAEAAHVDERTVQRVEAGKQVGAGTLKSLARALQLEDNYFIKHHAIKTAEELQREAEDFRRKFTVVEVTRISTGRALMDVLQGTDACSFHVHDEPPAEVSEVCARLFDYLRDCVDIWSDVPFSQRHEYQEEITNILDEMETAGYIVSVGSREAHFKSPNPDVKRYSMTLGYVVIAEKQKLPKALVVPRGVRFG